jgi:hypothetical protein
VKVHVVVRETGEYSDRSWLVVGVAPTQEAAAKLADKHLQDSTAATRKHFVEMDWDHKEVAADPWKGDWYDPFEEWPGNEHGYVRAFDEGQGTWYSGKYAITEHELEDTAA